MQMFATGGVATMDDSLAELAALIERKKDFDANRAKYEQRLGSIIEPTQPMDVFDAASALGRGLLETPNTGGASAYTGLAAGFNNIVEEQNRREETARQERQQIAMKAMELAMTDEREAEKLLTDYNFEQIKNANKKVDYVTIDYVEDGKRMTKRIADTNANAEKINELIAEKQGKIVEPIKVTQEIGGATPIDEEIIKQIGLNVKAYGEKAVAAKATIEQVAYANNLADELGPENFGPTQRAFLGMRQLATELGLGDIFNIEPTDLGMKTALNQLSMNFTMGIVSQTKGAISNKEMELFIQAAPTLGSTFEGFKEQLRLLDKLARRDAQFNTEYLKKLDKLNKDGKNATEIASEMAEFEINFQKDFPLFDENDRKIIDDAIANKDALAEGFDIDAYKKEIEEKKRAEAAKGGNENKNIKDFDGAEKDLYEKWLAKNPQATEEEKAAAKKIVLGLE